MFEKTQSELYEFMLGGETWEKFMLRIGPVMESSMAKKVDVDSPPTGKRPTVWVSKKTHDYLNGLRRAGETWGKFFHRVKTCLSKSNLEKNPN